ncbi:MAG: hypothetical protein RIA63_09340, partial [Cyclobacteriaceae bacterium]
MAANGSNFFNRDSSIEALGRRKKFLQEGIKKRVDISHSKEIDPALVVRVVQMRYDHCSPKYIASVLDIEEEIVSSVVKTDQKILQEFIGRMKANDALKLNRIPRTLNELREEMKEFGQWASVDDEYDNSLEILQLQTKRDVSDCRRKNFLKERLARITNYTGLSPTTFFWIKDKPFLYEIAFLNKNRVYHLIRKAPDYSISFIAEKCWQLFHEGFSAKEIDNIFEKHYAADFRHLAKLINLKIDRRNNSNN